MDVWMCVNIRESQRLMEGPLKVLSLKVRGWGLQVDAGVYMAYELSQS